MLVKPLSTLDRACLTTVLHPLLSLFFFASMAGWVISLFIPNTLAAILLTFITSFGWLRYSRKRVEELQDSLKREEITPPNP